jgi:hypothetical protein
MSIEPIKQKYDCSSELFRNGLILRELRLQVDFAMPYKVTTKCNKISHTVWKF